jgi:glycerol-3-phosphate acyltransferase PlsY
VFLRSFILTAVAAYLLGSIPTGFLVARARGIDLRQVGSGNIGATNAMRVLGKPAGILVLLVDAAKGWCAVWVAAWIFKNFGASEDSLESGRILAGVFAVLGHNYTCWLKFKGGKGIATTAGVYLALAPFALGMAFAVFVVVVLLTRYVSVGSMAGAVALPAAVWIQQPHQVLLGGVTTALGALAIYKHQSNIRRLLAGTENRLGKPSPPAEVKK